MTLRYVDRRLAAINGTVAKVSLDGAQSQSLPLRHGRWHRRPDLSVIVEGVRYKYAPGTTHKPCSRCDEIKPLSAFNPFDKGALGVSAKCKACLNAIGLAYTKRTRELRAGRPRPDRCEVCQAFPGKRALHWDHDHLTGKFRGWLCSGCNSALGHAGDNIALLKKLIGYLERQTL